MAQKAGSLLIEIQTDVARIRRELEQVKTSYKRMANDVEKNLSPIGRAFDTIDKNWRKFTATFGGGYVIKRGIDQLIQIYNSTTKAADAVAKFSQRIGVTTEALSALHFAAERSGVSISSFDMAMQRMTRRVAEASIGTGEAKQALIELRVSAVHLNQIGPEKAFLVLADALSKVPNQADRVRLAMKLFDSEGVAMLQLMNRGRAGIEELMQKAKDLGVVIGSDFAKQAEKARDAAANLDAAFQGLKNSIAIAITEPITDAIEKLTEFVTFINNNKDAIEFMFLASTGQYMKAGMKLKEGGWIQGLREGAFALQKQGQWVPPGFALAPDVSAPYGPRGAGIERPMDFATRQWYSMQKPSISTLGGTGSNVWYGGLGGAGLSVTGGAFLDPALGRLAAMGKLAEEFADDYENAAEQILASNVKIDNSLQELHDAHVQAYEAHVAKIQSISVVVGNYITQAFTSAFDSIFQEGQNFGEAMIKLFAAIGRDIAQSLLNELVTRGVFKLLMSAGFSGISAGLGGAGGGGTWMDLADVNLHTGGLIQGFARGGGVDDIPAMLQAGEFVIQRDAVKKMPMQFWEGLNRMHSGGAVPIGPQYFATGGLVNYGPYTWKGYTYTSDMLASMYGGTDPRVFYGPGWKPPRGSFLNPVGGTPISPQQLLQMDVWRIWQERNKPPAPPAPPPGPGPEPPGPEPPGPEPPGPPIPPIPPMPPEPPDYPPDFPDTGPAIPPEFLPWNTPVPEPLLPKYAYEMYQKYGYEPWGVTRPFPVQTPEWDRWSMPRLGTNLKEFLSKWGLNVRGDWSVTPESYQKYGGWAEPLAAMSLMSGVSVDQLANIGAIHNLISSPFESSINRDALTAVNRMIGGKTPGYAGTNIMSEVLEAMYFGLGTRGTMYPENVQTSYADLAQMLDVIDWNEVEKAFYGLKGGYEQFTTKAGHEKALTTRIYYDYMITQAMDYLRGIRNFKEQGPMLGVYPNWVHYGQVPGSIGYPSSWLPSGSLYYTPNAAVKHRGGFLGANEVPAILERGEVVIPRYHEGGVVGYAAGGSVQGGMGIRQPVTVNLINQTGIQMQAEEEFSFNNFSELVKTITLKAVRTDPSYRAMMRGK